MILTEEIYHLKGMSIQEGIEAAYRTKDGKLTMQYLTQITENCERAAKEFEIALKQFHYNFPLDGLYRISWKIEKIDDINF